MKEDNERKEEEGQVPEQTEEKKEYVFDFDSENNGEQKNTPRQNEAPDVSEKGGMPRGYTWGNGAPNGNYRNFAKDGQVSPDVYEQRRNMFSSSDSEPSKKKRKVWKTVGCCAAALAIAVAGFLGGYFTYAGSLDKEMRSLIWAKKQIQSDYYEEITNEQFYDAVFDGVNGLLDPYSQYLTAEEYADMVEEATGRWSGLGVTFSTRDAESNEHLLITRVSGNSPAEEAGILSGMYIVGFGADENSVTESESYDEFSVFLGSYEAGEEFVLRLRQGKDGTPFDIAIAKQSFVESYVFYRSNHSSYIFKGEKATVMVADPNRNFLTALDDDTAYIRFTQFNGEASSEFLQAMDKFKEEGKKNLILDLRANGGGYMNILCDIASYFCKDATGSNPVIAVASYRSGKEEKFKASGNKYYDYFSADSRISVMADNGTASASECLIGAMVDYKAVSYSDIYLSTRGDETKTYGKGIMQQTRPSSYFGKPDAIKLTTAKILWPVTGNCIHARGVLPEDGAHAVAENYDGDAEILAAWGMISAQ